MNSTTVEEISRLARDIAATKTPDPIRTISKKNKKNFWVVSEGAILTYICVALAITTLYALVKVGFSSFIPLIPGCLSLAAGIMAKSALKKFIPVEPVTILGEVLMQGWVVGQYELEITTYNSAKRRAEILMVQVCLDSRGALYAFELKVRQLSDGTSLQEYVKVEGLETKDYDLLDGLPSIATVQTGSVTVQTTSRTLLSGEPWGNGLLKALEKLQKA